MASIKGFQLKNIKNILGREGYGCTATMYLNGKKIGTYADYGDGACEEVNYVSNEAEMEMMKVIIEYAKTYNNEFTINLYKERPHQYEEECKNFRKQYPYIPESDINIQTMASNSIVYIVEDFLNLHDLEKIFKQYTKKGYKCISIDGDTITAYPISWSEEKIESHAKGNKIYKCLTDFIK